MSRLHRKKNPWEMPSLSCKPVSRITDPAIVWEGSFQQRGQEPDRLIIVLISPNSELSRFKSFGYFMVFCEAGPRPSDASILNFE